MQPFGSKMWETYEFRGHRVRVIQQWHDSFGRPMVRIETVTTEDPRAEGMPDAVFMEHATFSEETTSLYGGPV